MARRFLGGIDLLNQLVTAIGAQMSTGKLLGRSTAGSGAIEEISIGSGLSLSGGTLSTTGGGGGLSKFTEAESTASPNATVYVDSLKVAGTSTDVDVALVAKGAGATLAQVPDGTTAGGNKRGTYATDWQKSRSSASHVASGNFSVISGGELNTCSAVYGFVGGGYGNITSGQYGVICGGTTNTVTSNFSCILGGNSNTVSSGTYAFIGGGQLNSTTGSQAVVGGGYNNAVSGSSSSILGGLSNLLNYSNYGAICGGSNNKIIANATCGFIGGGEQNAISSGTHATIGGGFTNTSYGQYSFVGGGQSNTANVIGAVVAGGLTNNASGQYSAILGGSYGTTRGITGFQVFPACNAPIGTSQGCTQAGLLLLGRQTTNSTPTVLSSNSQSGATSNQLLLENNSACSFTGEVIATVGLAGATARWTISGAAKKEYTAASAALVGTPTVTMTHNDAGAAGWGVAVTVDTSRGCLSVTVTGAASTTIRWVCKIETTEVTF